MPINTFSAGSGYKTTTQKSECFYTREMKRKLKKTIPYTVASKRIKYLGDKLNEGGKRFVR